MKIACIGGGPAGWYSAYLLARQGHQVTVFERETATNQRGWGVVLSRQMVEQELDTELAQALAPHWHAWQQLRIWREAENTLIGGQDFVAIARSQLLQVMREHALAYGASARDAYSVDDVASLAPDVDLLLACDGLHSQSRQAYQAHFQPTISLGKCRYIWLGLQGNLDAFTFAFRETPHGWMQLHAYQYGAGQATCIVEMPEEVWQAAGFEDMSDDDSVAYCQQIFAQYVGDARFLLAQVDDAMPAQTTQWRQFATLECQQLWHLLEVQGKPVPLVLVGDSAHSAHFSIGSGTRLAMLAAATLARQIQRIESANDIALALNVWQSAQQLCLKRLRNAADNSQRWFEQTALYAKLPFPQFAYSLVTRSQRLLHDSLQQRDPAWLAQYEHWFATRTAHQTEPSSAIESATPPMFTPLTVRGLTLSNRVVVSPMAQYAARDGVVGDFHLMHLGSRAVGGAALVITEMLAISPQARITPACAGIYTPEQIRAWRRITDFVHGESGAKIGAQLGHAGAKGACMTPHEANDELGLGAGTPLIYDAPLASGAWPLVAASRYAYRAGVSVTAEAITLAQMQEVLQQFVAATQAAHEADFDWLELHCAHGYLLSSFLSPLTNRRDDEFGGDIAARCRFPLQVVTAVRAVWPAHKPLSVRLSVQDWVEGGNTIEDAVVIATLMQQTGVDVITCSSGQVSTAEKVRYGRMYQTPFADRIRNQCRIMTMAVGAISDAAQVNSIIAAGRADLCAIGRPHLADPHWTLHQAAEIGYQGLPWHRQYLAAKSAVKIK